VQSNRRGLVVIGAALAVVLVIIVAAGLAAQRLINDPEETATFAPDTDSTDFAACTFSPPPGVLIAYESPTSNLAESRRVIEVAPDTVFQVVGIGEGFYLIALPAGDKVWVRDSDIILSGECSVLPFEPGTGASPVE